MQHVSVNYNMYLYILFYFSTMTANQRIAGDVLMDLCIYFKESCGSK